LLALQVVTFKAGAKLNAAGRSSLRLIRKVRGICIFTIEGDNGMQTEVIVIGAGAAGLAAAESLSAAGLQTLILEARERVGGRIYTLYDGGFPIELGAEFIHGKPSEILNLASVDDLPLKKLTGKNWSTNADGEIMPEYENGNEDEIWQKLERFSGADMSFTEFLKKNFAAPEFEKARRSAARYVEGFHAADPSEVSVRSLQKTERATGTEDFRFRGGYENLTRRLCQRTLENGAELRMGQKVKTIEWRKNRVEVGLADRSKTYLARSAVFTLPLGVWQAGQVSFAPSLPAEKEAALQKMKMGTVVRVSFRFRRNWWAERLRPKGNESLGFLFSNDPEIPVWWTGEPEEGHILTGWAGGAQAEKNAGQGTDRLISAATRSLARIFKVGRSLIENEIENVFTHDWQRDELTLGSYSYILTGGAGAPEVLARPVAETLFFAGEATNSEGHWATVHGAIATGKRAAQEVISTIKCI
jgi:monoamine oxidase